MHCIVFCVYINPCKHLHIVFGFNQIKYIVNDKQLYILMGKFRNALNQIHANLLQNHFSSNIIHVKYNTFILTCFLTHFNDAVRLPNFKISIWVILPLFRVIRTWMVCFLSRWNISRSYILNWSCSDDYYIKKGIAYLFSKLDIFNSIYTLKLNICFFPPDCGQLSGC